MSVNNDPTFSPKLAEVHAAVGWLGEVVYRRLLRVSGIGQCFPDSPVRIRNACFPDADVPATDVSKAIDALVNAGLARRFEAKEGVSFLRVFDDAPLAEPPPDESVVMTTGNRPRSTPSDMPDFSSLPWFSWADNGVYRRADEIRQIVKAIGHQRMLEVMRTAYEHAQAEVRKGGDPWPTSRIIAYAIGIGSREQAKVGTIPVNQSTVRYLESSVRRDASELKPRV